MTHPLSVYCGGHGPERTRDEGQPSLPAELSLCVGPSAMYSPTHRRCGSHVVTRSHAAAIEPVVVEVAQPLSARCFSFSGLSTTYIALISRPAISSATVCIRPSAKVTIQPRSPLIMAGRI